MNGASIALAGSQDLAQNTGFSADQEQLQGAADGAKGRHPPVQNPAAFRCLAMFEQLQDSEAECRGRHSKLKRDPVYEAYKHCISEAENKARRKYGRLQACVCRAYTVGKPAIYMSSYDLMTGKMPWKKRRGCDMTSHKVEQRREKALNGVIYAPY